MGQTRSSPHLARAGAKRSLDAEQRVRSALRELDREGASISFAAVAKRAGVSRHFLYNHRDFRSEIEALRHAQGEFPSRLPVRERASDSSVRARLRAALDDNQRQRQELSRLREELAIAHGLVRELELEQRARR
jgi:hypothetical protein